MFARVHQLKSDFIFVICICIPQQGAPPAGTELRQLDHGSNSKPTVEETAQALGSRLRDRRRELGLPLSLKVGRG